MLIIFSVLIGGVILGRILREKNLKSMPKIITIIIWTLLFLLGLEVGSNHKVVANLSTLGVTALAVAAASVAGSVLFSWILWKFIKRRNNEG